MGVSRDLGASQANGLGSAEAPEPSGLGPTGAIPSAIRDAVLKMGRVDWGGVGPKPDAEHVSDFTDSLAITREHFGFDGPRYLCGVYLEGTETVLCHTGTSPNSPTNARAIAGIWNWLVEQCAASVTLTEGGDAKQAPGDSLSGAASEAGDAQ